MSDRSISCDTINWVYMQNHTKETKNKYLNDDEIGPVIQINPISGLLQRFASMGMEKIFKPGDVLFYQSDIVEKIFVIESGSVDLSITYTNGTKKTITHCSDGVILGEMALFHEYKNVSEAVVKEPSRIFVVEINKVREAFCEDTTFAKLLYNSISAKLQLITNQLGIMMLESIPSRIAHVLLDFHQEEILLTHDEIASLVKCSRVSATRHLRRLTKQRIIANQRGRIIIVDRAALAELI